MVTSLVTIVLVLSCVQSVAEVDSYLRDDKLENKGLTKQIQAAEAQIIETIFPTPLPYLIT